MSPHGSTFASDTGRWRGLVAATRSDTIAPITANPRPNNGATLKTAASEAKVKTLLATPTRGRGRPPRAAPASANLNEVAADASSVVHGDGSLVEHAIKAVTDYIHAHSMRAGDTLPSEQFFIEHLGVSRTVMRETFRSLAALRVIDVGNGRKARVCAMDSRVMATSLHHAVGTAQISIAEIWEVRRTIETKTAARAAVLRTEVEAQAIMALSEGMADITEDLAGLIRLDLMFHKAIARASKNTFFEQLVSSFDPLMRLVAEAAWQTRTTKNQKREIVRIHQAIARAILKQNAEDAAHAMDLHFDHAVEYVLHRVAPTPKMSS